MSKVVATTLQHIRGSGGPKVPNRFHMNTWVNYDQLNGVNNGSTNISAITDAGTGLQVFHMTNAAWDSFSHTQVVKGGWTASAEGWRNIVYYDTTNPEHFRIADSLYNGAITTLGALADSEYTKLMRGGLLA